MTKHSSARIAGSVIGLIAIVLALRLSKSPRAHANDDDSDTRIEIGFKIAPVPLNLEGKDRDMVGLGSYLVNAIGDCNGCHSSGSAPLGIYPYVTGNNPYFSQPEKIDPTVYLSGGASFGTVGTPTGPNNYSGPAIIARNLTPDKTGRAEGGHTRLPSSSGCYGTVKISTTSIPPVQLTNLQRFKMAARPFAFPLDP
jgi:hypothetical protein